MGAALIPSYLHKFSCYVLRLTKSSEFISNNVFCISLAAVVFKKKFLGEVVTVLARLPSSRSVHSRITPSLPSTPVITTTLASLLVQQNSIASRFHCKLLRNNISWLYSNIWPYLGVVPCLRPGQYLTTFLFIPVYDMKRTEYADL
jgi:hypothetical protein